MSPTYRSGLTALVAATLLASTSTAHAALTTPTCLAKKLTAWGGFRKCQATEIGNALKGRSADPAKCQTRFALRLTALSAQATAATIACRYGDNGDGTATDYDTGLQWEQKANLDSTPNNADPHDADNTYVWSASGDAPDGTAFTSFLASLNECSSSDGTTLTGGFAGHCDWRLPSIVELAGIVDLSAPGCGTGSPCIDQTIFGPTPALIYWSATTDVTFPLFGTWYVHFGGSVPASVGGGVDDFHVRGVRSVL